MAKPAQPSVGTRLIYYPTPSEFPGGCAPMPPLVNYIAGSAPDYLQMVFTVLALDGSARIKTAVVNISTWQSAGSIPRRRVGITWTSALDFLEGGRAMNLQQLISRKAAEHLRAADAAGDVLLRRAHRTAADTASRTLERLGKNISLALRTPTSDAAKAFKALGISEEELKRASTDLDYGLRLLAEKFVEFQGTPSKTAAYMAILGRGMENLIPYFAAAPRTSTNSKKPPSRPVRRSTTRRSRRSPTPARR